MSETTDLRPWGWAPGGYSIRCRDCSPNAQVPGASGDKRCWRCEPCARKAMEREPVTTCDACAGTGGGHPDNFGYHCDRCGGSGGVKRPLTAENWRELVASFQRSEAAYKAEISRLRTLLHRWAASDGGSWHVARYGRELAELKADTKRELGA